MTSVLNAKASFRELSPTSPYHILLPSNEKNLLHYLGKKKNHLLNSVEINMLCVSAVQMIAPYCRQGKDVT